MKMMTMWLAFLTVFGFALFLGLDQGHQQVQQWLVPAQAEVVRPSSTPSPTSMPTPATSLSVYTPNHLESLSDITGSVLQKTAQKGVELTVAVFDQLLN
jgi:hypothetical protein